MSEADGGSVAIIVAVVSGLCSLLGAFAGSALSRKSDHIKWLRENQSEVFATFLEKLQIAKDQAFLVEIEHAKKGTNNSLDLIEAFSEAMRYERIVRLYLRESNRKHFSDLVQRYWKFTASSGKYESDKPTATECLNEIQRIFESELVG